MASGNITFEEYLALTELTFEWAESYDTKDWSRLRAILAPELLIDYTDVIGRKWDNMSADDFVKLASSKMFLGDPLLLTQHFFGASKWEKTSPTEVTGVHQLRAAHQRYTGPDRKEVEAKGHGHAVMRHTYKKVGQDWKIAGAKPTVRWNEYDFDKVVAASAKHFSAEKDADS